MIEVNASDREWTKHTYTLWFGAYGDTRLVVHANSLDAALDEAVDYLADHEPGLLADEQVEEAYQAAIEAGATDEEAWNEAMTDTTTAGNCGHYLLSWEWGIVSEETRQ